MNVATLKRQGFDQSKHIPFTGQTRVRCSQCRSTVVNNVPIHGHGCPNETTKCVECDADIPKNHRYCEECAI
jgi:hypothetical protein